MAKGPVPYITAGDLDKYFTMDMEYAYILYHTGKIIVNLGWYINGTHLLVSSFIQ